MKVYFLQERLVDMEDFTTALVFFVNGRKVKGRTQQIFFFCDEDVSFIFFIKVVEPNPDPEWTLLRYLREKRTLTKEKTVSFSCFA